MWLRVSQIFIGIASLACIAVPGARAQVAALLEVSGSTGVVKLGRGDLAFNFQDGPGGVDGQPFRIGAFDSQGSIDAGVQPKFSVGPDGITGEYGGKFTVTVRWSKAGATTAANQVDADVTIANHLAQPILEYSLQLLKLRFPTAPVSNTGNATLRAYNTGSPGIFIANYADAKPGALVCDLEGVDAAEPLLMELGRGNAADANGSLIVMNHHDYNDGGSPFPYWPIPAGGTIHFRVGLRFSAPDPDPMVVCGDLFAAFAKRYLAIGAVANWPDRRPIAQVFFESDNTNGGLNPRKWFDASEHIDVTTPAGVKHFQEFVFDRARGAIQRMKRMHAQGVITWDVEGAQFPGATYMGDPTMVATADPSQSVAPEMAQIVDQYFKLYRDAGFRVGLTLRPQKVVLQRDAQGKITNAWEYEDGWDWKTAPPADIQQFWQQQLEQKIRFAQQRWGATIFYVDSNGDPGSPVSFLVFRNLAAEFPDTLIIPEQSTLGYYSATAPYRQLNMVAPVNITSPLVRETWPPAGDSPCFSVINPTIESMTKSWPQLVQDIRAGDVLFFRAWYDAPELPAIERAYAEARRKNPATR